MGSVKKMEDLEVEKRLIISSYNVKRSFKKTRFVDFLGVELYRRRKKLLLSSSVFKVLLSPINY